MCLYHDVISMKMQINMEKEKKIVEDYLEKNKTSKIEVAIEP